MDSQALNYAFLIVAALLAGSQFVAMNSYQAQNGKAFRSILFFCFVSSLIGGLIFLAITGFTPEWKALPFFLALATAVVALTLNSFGIKALSIGNVPTYSLFMVAGGMVPPYVFGLLYYRDPWTPFQLAGLAIIMVSLLIPVLFHPKGESKIRPLFFALCALLFVLNGAYCILNKFAVCLEDAIPVSDFMFYYFAWFATLSGGLLLALLRKHKEETKALFNWKGLLFVAIYATVNSMSLLLQYMASTHVSATVSFPLLNGSVIVFSTLVGAVAYRKAPNRIEVLQALTALVGTALFLF